MIGTLPTALRRLSAAVLLTLASMPLAGASRAMEITTPIVSGLPWRSGASVEAPFVDFASWRGRKLDALVIFVPLTSWDAMTTRLSGSALKTSVKRSPLLVISLPMLPNVARKQFVACARGDFNDYFRRFGQLIAAAGAGQAVIRLGWEPNHVSRSWGPDTAADIPHYVKCFQQEVEALKSTAPGLRIEWAMGRHSTVPFNVMAMYPGNAHVDHFGVHHYDNIGPKISTQAAWDQHYLSTYMGGPKGLGTWLAEAKARGKKLAVSEWGTWDQGDISKADNPVYIDNMYQFFRTNAANIAYENYYNRSLRHQLYPSTKFPKARVRYQQLW
jgi:hypothetical protein